MSVFLPWKRKPPIAACQGFWHKETRTVAWVCEQAVTRSKRCDHYTDDRRIMHGHGGWNQKTFWAMFQDVYINKVKAFPWNSQQMVVKTQEILLEMSRRGVGRMKQMDSCVLQFACWINPCFHPKVKVWTLVECFSKTMKSVRKDWPYQKETETSCQKDDSFWDKKDKMYSLENFRRDWHPVGNIMWRKLHKDKEMSEKRTESWADDGDGHTCVERKKAIPGHWL